jgi:hypothetical protein
MGEWKYTQGCAHCDSVVANRGEFTEDPVNYALRRGDCTDFVYLAIENVLLSSWNHDKISTSMYNNSTATQLDSYGFTEVTLANARMGDVVVRTKTDGCLCGHAGLFAGRGVGGSIVGYANNGIPARPGQKNVDSTTSVYDFRVKEGYVTKLFRPVVP